LRFGESNSDPHLPISTGDAADPIRGVFCAATQESIAPEGGSGCDKSHPYKRMRIRVVRRIG
jgi:hypothetical protein